MTDELEGRTVVVTRAEEPDGPLARRLRGLGAEVLLLPTVEIGPPADPAPLERACAELPTFDWIVFTSARAVWAVADRAGELLAKRAGEIPAGRVTEHPFRVAVVGPATRAAAETAGFDVDVEGSGGGGGALADALVDAGVGAGDRVLFPSSDRARPELADRLEDAGADLTTVVAYETRIGRFDPASIPGLDEVDAVTFTSPSAVDGWHASVGADARWQGRGVAIGTSTADRADELGLVVRVAPEATLDGVARGVVALCAERPAALDEGRDDG